jgi:hypothetical protein
VTSRFARGRRITQVWFVRSHLVLVSLLCAVLVCACSHEPRRTGIQVYVTTDHRDVREVRIDVADAADRVVRQADEPIAFFLEPTAALDAGVSLTVRGYASSQRGGVSLTGEHVFELKFEPRRTTVALLSLSADCRHGGRLDLAGKLPSYTGRAVDGEPSRVCMGEAHFDDAGPGDDGDDAGDGGDDVGEGPAGWAVRAGGPLNEDWIQVAADAEGGVFAAGLFRESATVQDRSLVAAGGEDSFVAKYDAHGKLLWLKQLGGAGDTRIDTLTVDAAGNPIAGGYFTGTLIAGEKPVAEAEGDQDGFVVALDGAAADAEPSVRWLNTFGGPGRGTANGLAIDEQGVVWVAGDMGTSVRSGLGACEATQASSGMFVAGLDGTSGSCRRVTSFAATGLLVAPRIAVAADGTLMAGCSYTTGSVHALDGDAEFVAPSVPFGFTNGFVVKLTTDLETVWARALGRGGDCMAGGLALTGVAVAPSGDVLAAGPWRSCVAVTSRDSSTTLLSSESTSLQPAVLRLTSAGDLAAHALSGVPQGQRPNGDVSLWGFMLDAQGGFVLTGGTRSDAYDFGAGSRPKSGATTDAYVAHYSPAGTLLWMDQLGERESSLAKSSALDSEGRLVVGGYFFGTVQPRRTNALESGNQDLFVVRYPHRE